MLLTISCSLRSIKIRSVRRAVPTSCKPSNYGYNRHHVAHWTAPSIRSKTSEREFPLPWNFSRVCPPRKYSSPADVISSKVSVSFSLYQGREKHTGLSFDSVSHFVRRKSNRCNWCYERTTHDRSRSQQNRSRSLPKSFGSKYVTRKSLARSPPRGTCERLKTLQRAIRYPRNYVYPSPLVWNDSYDDGIRRSLEDCSLVNEIIDSHIGEYVKWEWCKN